MVWHEVQNSISLVYFRPWLNPRENNIPSMNNGLIKMSFINQDRGLGS